MTPLPVAIALEPGFERLPTRERTAITGLVVQRIEVSQEDSTYGDSPKEIARFFREHPIGRGATGGEMPYPVLIDASGLITQTVPLGRVTPHARAHNPTTIGVGCIGDFRGKAPTRAQRQALVSVCAHLCAVLALPVTSIRGHDELTGGSSDPNKICPGDGLSLAELRAEVERALRPDGPLLELVW